MKVDAGRIGVDRIWGVDLSRGLAMLGMFAAHTLSSSTETVFDGRSSILFATVAGVSLGLMSAERGSSGSRPAPPALRTPVKVSIAIRALVLILVGLLLDMLLPPVAVILDYYGFAFLLLLPVLFVRRRVLAGLAALVAVLSPAIVDGLLATVDGDAIPIVFAPLTRWLIFGTYPMLIWLAFFLVGIAAARRDLGQRRTQVALLVGGVVVAVLGYGAAALVPGVTAAAHSGSSAEVLGSGGVAVAVIGLCALGGSVGGRVGRGIRLILGPVAAAGAMALTLYTAHVLVLTAIRAVIGAEADYPWWVLPSLIVAALVFGAVWQRKVGSGPMERGLQLLTRSARLKA